LATGYNLIPGGAHFLPYFVIDVCEIAETKIFAFFKVGRDPTICLSIDGMKAAYRLFQTLVIRNYDLQSSARNAPFSECPISFRKCSNDAIIRKRRSASALKYIEYTLMGTQ